MLKILAQAIAYQIKSYHTLLKVEKYIFMPQKIAYPPH